MPPPLLIAAQLSADGRGGDLAAHLGPLCVGIVVCLAREVPALKPLSDISVGAMDAMRME